MKQQDKLKDTLREYYDNQQVPYNENEWERASAYLNSARRGRRIRNSALILTTLLAILFITLFNIPELKRDEKNRSSLVSNQKSKSAPTTGSEILQAPTVSAAKTKHNINLNPNTPSDLHAPEEISAPENNKNIPDVRADVPSHQSPKVAESNTARSHPAEQNTANETGSTKTYPLVASVTTVNLNTNTTKPECIESLTPVDTKENTEIIPVAVENLQHDQNQVQAKEVPQPPANVIPQAMVTPAVNDNTKETAIEVKKFDSPGEKTPVTVVDTSHTTPVISTTTTSQIAIRDTLPGSSSFTQLPGEGIFYEAGAAWYYGWKGPVNRDARGFSPIAGINYMNQLSKRCAFSFGLQYLWVPNLSNSSKTSRVSSYKYGEESRVTVITPSTVHYLVVPLRFHYFVNRQNCIGAGVNMAYLLNVDATVTNYDESPGLKTNYKTVKLSGYTEGFSWFDSQLAFFYRRRIGNYLGLQAEFFMGLTDVKQDEFFGFSNKERNSGAKLSLVYYPFRKNSR